MKQIGQILKDARIKKEYSLKYVEDKTKIKSNFIEAIEDQKWEGLPAFPTVLGFVKNLSIFLDLDDIATVAILKRDYPPRKLTINPKPDVAQKFSWSPKLTFTIAIATVLLLVFGYLIFQYFQFISPPQLAVDSPKENQLINGTSVLVFGTTNTDAKITVNNQPVIVDDNGKFSVSINIVPETTEITITAISRSGKMNEVRRKIQIQGNRD